MARRFEYTRGMVLLVLAVLTLAQRPAAAPAQEAPPAASESVAAEMLQLARVAAGDVVYGLGSIATIPQAAARVGARGVAIEFEAALRPQALADATVVTLDLTPALNLRLEPILRELRPGTRIVSHRYGIGAWRAEESVTASDGMTIFLWTVPRRPVRTPDIFFVPTDQPIVEQMLELAGVTAKDVVYDLGSGDGRIVVIAAQNHGARGVGVEIDPELVQRARQVARDAQLSDKVTFLEGDLFEADLSAATVVTLFLSDGINRRLEAKLKRELKPGARVVSRRFRIVSWEPDRTMTAADGTSLFLWIVKEPQRLLRLRAGLPLL